MAGHVKGTPVFVPGLTSVVFSPDGSKLATGGEDGFAIVWDVRTGQELLSIQSDAEGGGISRLAFGPDGRLLATASTGSLADENDAMVNVWNLTTWEKTFTYPTQGQVQAGIWGLAFSPDGKRVAVGAGGGMLKILDTSTGKELLNFTGHISTVSSVDFSPDGKYLASVGPDGTARVWDATSGEEMRIFTSPSGPLFDVAFTPDGKNVITSGQLVYGYIFDLDELVRLAYSRLTRWFTLDECHQFLHQEECPPR